MPLTCWLRESTDHAVGVEYTTGGRSLVVFAYGAKWLEGAETFGVLSDNTIVTTGTRRRHEIEAVLVDPLKYGMVWDKLLMKHREELAMSRGGTHVTLHSSITSKAFHGGLPYETPGETYEAVGGQIVLMTKKPLKTDVAEATFINLYRLNRHDLCIYFEKYSVAGAAVRRQHH